MIDKQKVEAIVNEWLAGKDYFLTDVQVSDDDRIVVEIDHKDGVWIDDCVELSQYIEAHLDREEEDYELEVGSAGIGQPFKVVQQYFNHIGDEIEVLTQTGNKLQGLLTEAADDSIVVNVKTKIKPEGCKRPKIVEVANTIPFSDIKEARAVIKF